MPLPQQGGRLAVASIMLVLQSSKGQQHLTADPPEILNTELDSDCLKTNSRERMSKTFGY